MTKFEVTCRDCGHEGDLKDFFDCAIVTGNCSCCGTETETEFSCPKCHIEEVL